MVVNAPDSPVQAEVIFVIEATAANGAYIGELKTNYIVPTLEYFHGGALEEGGGSGSLYSVVAYKAADCHPGLPVATYGPFTCPQTVVETVDKIQYIGGHAESRACVTEALTAALACFEELGRKDVPAHILLLCCSPPYSAYAGGLVPAGAPATAEVAARLLGERGAHVSVAAARRVPALHKLYELAGGELHQAQQRNYAKDPRHLVLLRGYSLKERPPSPAPPPVPDIQPDVYGLGRGAGVAGRPGGGNFPRAGGPGAGAGGGAAGAAGGAAAGGAGAGARGAGWLGGQLAPPRPPLYASNSALLTQLAQPSYPPPPPTHPAPRMPNMLSPGPSGAGGAQAPLQRSYIWSGVIEWMEKGKSPGDQQKMTKHLPCQVSASTKDIEPELKVDTWPNKLLMQLMPKQLISNIGGQYLKDSKSVLFHLQPSEALDSLTKVMVNGFAGCVHFSPMPTPPQCDIKVLILLYTPDKKAYLGFIPNHQATFVDRLRKVIQQQKNSQMLGKQQQQQLSAGVSGAGGMQPNISTANMTSMYQPQPAPVSEPQSFQGYGRDVASGHVERRDGREHGRWDAGGGRRGRRGPDAGPRAGPGHGADADAAAPAAASPGYDDRRRHGRAGRPGGRQGPAPRHTAGRARGRPAAEPGEDPASAADAGGGSPAGSPVQVADGYHVASARRPAAGATLQAVGRAAAEAPAVAATVARRGQHHAAHHAAHAPRQPRPAPSAATAAVPARRRRPAPQPAAAVRRRQQLSRYVLNKPSPIYLYL